MRSCGGDAVVQRQLRPHTGYRGAQLDGASIGGRGRVGPGCGHDADETGISIYILLYRDNLISVILYEFYSELQPPCITIRGVNRNYY